MYIILYIYTEMIGYIINVIGSRIFDIKFIKNW